MNALKKPAIPTEMRVELLKKATRHISGIEVVAHSGLVTEFAEKHYVQFLIRGVRSLKDFESELSLAAINKELFYRPLDTVFLPTDAKYAHISSSLVRELALFKKRHRGVMPSSIEDEVYDYLIKY